MPLNNKINEILDEIFSVYPKKRVLAIVLFGSRARGDNRADSDYNVNVYAKSIARKDRDNISRLEDINIDVVDREKLNFYISRGHPHLYCAFRDGVVLYQQNKWFDETKRTILEIKPSREMVSRCLTSSLENFLRIKNCKNNFLLNYIEDGKVAANQLGFALLMHHGFYPISPHSLEKELKDLNRKYTRVSILISYAQEMHYKNKKMRFKDYHDKVGLLYNFTKKYILDNFPEKRKELMELERLYKKT